MLNLDMDLASYAMGTEIKDISLILAGTIRNLVYEQLWSVESVWFCYIFICYSCLGWVTRTVQDNNRFENLFFALKNVHFSIRWCMHQRQG